MTTEEFVSHVNSLPPDKEEWHRLLAQKYPSWSNEEIDCEVSSYYLTPNELSDSVDLPEDPLLRLVILYGKPGNFILGDFSLAWDLDIHVNRKISIGGREHSFVVLNPLTNEIEEIDMDDVEYEYNTVYCAKNSSCFLDALLPAVAAFKKQNFEDPSRPFDLRTATVLAQECARLAGGSRYLRFYEELFGVSY